MLKNNRIARSFIIQVADLVFHIEPNTLTVSDGVSAVSTEVSRDEIEILSAFADQAKSVVSPLANSEVIYSTIDGPQKISLVKKGSDYMLIINSQIQFTTKSEEIYHEALVHPAFGSITNPKTCLILGGGDGLAAKQIFRHYPETQVTLVDFDKNITDLFTYEPVMKAINEGAMSKCNVINADAFQYVWDDDNKYDVIICDFPDPDADIFNKLYSIELYGRLREMLNDKGSMVVQSGSLVPNSKCYSCITKTLSAAGFYPQSYYTPTTYGELVYNLCHKQDNYESQNLSNIVFPDNLNTMNKEFFLNAMTYLRPGLVSKEDVEVNTTQNMAALSYRLEELENIKK
jgi:spermidine synthase